MGVSFLRFAESDGEEVRYLSAGSTPTTSTVGSWPRGEALRSERSYTGSNPVDPIAERSQPVTALL